MTVADALAPAKPRRPVRPPNLKPHKRAAVAVSIAGAAGVAALAASGPDFDVLFAAPMVIQVHVYAAVAAFVLGAVILLARKGKAFHIAAGWTWVVLMAVTAGVSLFITGINGNAWSWIHILSGSTLLVLPLAVVAARRRNINMHRNQMVGLYVGGMIIAGGFTFVPGRLMWQIFFG